MTIVLLLLCWWLWILTYTCNIRSKSIYLYVKFIQSYIENVYRKYFFYLGVIQLYYLTYCVTNYNYHSLIKWNNWTLFILNNNILILMLYFHLIRIYALDWSIVDMLLLWSLYNFWLVKNLLHIIKFLNSMFFAVLTTVTSALNC